MLFYLRRVRCYVCLCGSYLRKDKNAWVPALQPKETAPLGTGGRTTMGWLSEASARWRMIPRYLIQETGNPGAQGDCVLRSLLTSPICKNPGQILLDLFKSKATARIFSPAASSGSFYCFLSHPLEALALWEQSTLLKHQGIYPHSFSSQFPPCEPFPGTPQSGGWGWGPETVAGKGMPKGPIQSCDT